MICAQFVYFSEAEAFIVKYSQGEWPDRYSKKGPDGTFGRTLAQVKSMVYALGREMKVRTSFVMYNSLLATLNAAGRQNDTS